MYLSKKNNILLILEKIGTVELSNMPFSNKNIIKSIDGNMM